MLGNPFVLGEHGSRDEVVEKYRRWLWEQIKEEGAVYRELLRLKAAAQKRELLLVCWCKRPNKEVACHGDIIKQAIEWLDRWERGIPEPQAHSLIHDLPSSVELPVEQLSFCEHLTMSTEATSAPEEISDELAETAIGWNAPVVLQNREATVPVQQSVDGTPAQLMQDDIQPCLPSVVEHSPRPESPSDESDQNQQKPSVGSRSLYRSFHYRHETDLHPRLYEAFCGQLLQRHPIRWDQTPVGCASK